MNKKKKPGAFKPNYMVLPHRDGPFDVWMNGELILYLCLRHGYKTVYIEPSNKSQTIWRCIIFVNSRNKDASKHSEHTGLEHSEHTGLETAKQAALAIMLNLTQPVSIKEMCVMLEEDRAIWALAKI